MDFSTAKQKNGSVIFRNVEYAIINPAQSDNYGTAGEVRYYSAAIDQDGKKFKIEWVTTAEWDASNAIAQQQMRGSEPDMEAIAKEFGIDANDFSPYSLLDESDACNWDKPFCVVAQ